MKRAQVDEGDTGPSEKRSCTSTSAPPAAPVPNRCVVLRYTYVEGILEKRAPHRAGHLALWKALVEKGQLLLGGALDPPSAAYFMLKGLERAEIEKLVEGDPYVVNGLVPSHEISDWNVMVESSSEKAASQDPPPAVPVPTKCLLLHYAYVEDILEKRGPHRAGHLGHWKALADKGQLLLGGALDPPEGAYLVIRDLSRQDVESLVSTDPYFTNDLVPSYAISEWNVVIGSRV